MKNLSRLPDTVCSSLCTSIYLLDLTRVVEELMVNSLDAGSTKVCIFIDVGGCCIKVEDNGCGITRQELVLLGEKYGSISETSKVHHVVERDANVVNFSQRGGTLGSLSDISLLEVITKACGVPNGYRKIMKGWKSLYLGIDNRRKDVGTTVIVRDLFHNQVVRRRNMQASPKKILYSVKKCVIDAALVHTHISFTIIDMENGTEILSTAPSMTPLSLVSNHFGREVSDSLDEINISDGVLQLSGYLSRPTDMVFAKALQNIYINTRLICKGHMHKLIETLATDPQNSSNICSSISEFQRTKRRKIQGHAAYILKLSCPFSIYEPSGTSAEFKDWDFILTFIKHAVTRFWKSNSGSISKEFNEISPSNRVSDRDVYTAEMPKKSRMGKKKHDLRLDWNFIPVTESPNSHSLKMPEFSNSYEIQDSLAGYKSSVKNVKSHWQMPSSIHQVICFPDDIAQDTQDISCPMEDHTNFQNYSMHKTQKLDNDFASDDIQHPDHNLIGTDKDDCSFSSWEDMIADKIIKHNSRDSENSMKIPFVSKTSCCPNGIEKQELLGDVDESEFILKETVSDYWSNENFFSLECLDNTDAAHCSGNSHQIVRAVCGDKISKYQSSFVMKKCQTKAESNFFERDLMEVCYEEGKCFTKERKTKPSAWECDFIGDFSHPFIDLDWCFGSPCCTNESVSRTIEHSDNHTVERKRATYVTSYFDDFYRDGSEDTPAFIDGQSYNQFWHRKGCKMSTDDGKLFLSPDKITVNKYHTDRSEAKDWLFGSAAKIFSSIDSSDHTYRIKCNIPQFVNGWQNHATIRIRSRRSHSAPPFPKCKRRFFVAYDCPSAKSGEATFMSQNANNSHETGITIGELSKPRVLSQPYVEQNFEAYSPNRPYAEKDLEECSPNHHRCLEGQHPQVYDRDGFLDFFKEKVDDFEGGITKWRCGDPTCVERSEKFSDRNDDILDISSGLLKLAGGFLEPESISRNVLEDSKVLLQLDKKFIPIVAGGNLAVVDQHAADERIRLEELRQKVFSGECNQIIHLESEQELVLPEMGFQLLQNYAEQIRSWGWICNIHSQCSESFSENLDILKRSPSDVTLVAVPCILGITLTDSDLVEFLEQLAETDGSATTPPSVNRVLSLKACRGAIMFGDSLLPSECSLIIEELKSTSLCFQCAHGRPTTAPLVNIFELHKQLDKLSAQNRGQTRDWHGIFRHKPTYRRAQQRLEAAKRFKTVAHD